MTKICCFIWFSLICNVCSLGLMANPLQADQRPLLKTQNLALLTAAKAGDLAAVKTALIKGADPRSADSLGITVLEHAAPGGGLLQFDKAATAADRDLLQRRLDIIKVLVTHGANIRADMKKVSLLGFGELLMISSLDGGRYDLTQVLLAHGIGKNVLYFGGVLRPYYAQRAKPDPAQRQLFRYILAQPPPPLFTRKLYFTLALFDAVQLNDGIFFVKDLLREGADVNGYNYMGSTPLITAVRSHNTPIVAFLLQHGADPNKPYVYVDKSGGYKSVEAKYNNMKPLDFATQMGFTDIVQLLQPVTALHPSVAKNKLPTQTKNIHTAIGK